MPQSTSAKTSFGAVCVAKIEDSGRTVKEIAAKLVRTPASQFTRWKKGLWTYILPEKVQEVAEAISDDPRDQCDVVLAYLHDMTPLKYRPMIMHGQKGEVPFSVTDGQAPWSDPAMRRLKVIAESYELDADYAAMVDHLVNWGKRLKK